MLNYLFDWLIDLDFPGVGVFQYISVRSAMSIITALIISTLFGKKMISLLRRKQVGELVRDLGLNGQMEKEGTPTMGGIIILISILIPALLFARLDNIYVILMLITTVWLGLIGFADDYIKVFKKNKAGLAGKFKIFGQVFLALIVGLVMFFHPDVVIGEKKTITDGPAVIQSADGIILNSSETTEYNERMATTTTIPFVKNNEFDYSWVLGWISERAQTWTWLVFVLIVIFIITAVSNGANMTDGLDGLATGSSAIMGVTLGILAYVSGHFEIANYLNIMYIPNSGELVVFDLVERKVIWADLAYAQHRKSYRGNNTHAHQATIAEMLRGVVNTENRVSLYELFELHGNARGTLVETAAEADTIFSIDTGITPYDITEINSDYIV
jgi:phospho-N-acetylmuramoyl-pentapeptide-transferase